MHQHFPHQPYGNTTPTPSVEEVHQQGGISSGRRPPNVSVFLSAEWCSLFFSSKLGMRTGEGSDGRLTEIQVLPDSHDKNTWDVLLCSGFLIDRFPLVCAWYTSLRERNEC